MTVLEVEKNKAVLYHFHQVIPGARGQESHYHGCRRDAIAALRSFVARMWPIAPADCWLKGALGHWLEFENIIFSCFSRLLIEERLIVAVLLPTAISHHRQSFHWHWQPSVSTNCILCLAPGVGYLGVSINTVDYSSGLQLRRYILCWSWAIYCPRTLSIVVRDLLLVT